MRKVREPEVTNKVAQLFGSSFVITLHVVMKPFPSLKRLYTSCI